MAWWRDCLEGARYTQHVDRDGRPYWHDHELHTSSWQPSPAVTDTTARAPIPSLAPTVVPHSARTASEDGYCLTSAPPSPPRSPRASDGALFAAAVAAALAVLLSEDGAGSGAVPPPVLQDPPPPAQRNMQPYGPVPAGVGPGRPRFRLPPSGKARVKCRPCPPPDEAAAAPVVTRKPSKAGLAAVAELGGQDAPALAAIARRSSHIGPPPPPPPPPAPADVASELTSAELALAHMHWTALEQQMAAAYTQQLLNFSTWERQQLAAIAITASHQRPCVPATDTSSSEAGQRTAPVW
eukprot:TRINITY_DN3501_c8_g1_i1.p1 TRINITY_DN3501_c8_g1~~TRINITY_DN3501_c8_g1_i1.p1  ORF type:complete len:296 (+),score=46.57 TRINITY_DN3501_c8_g1_i1:58-945(+)